MMIWKYKFVLSLICLGVITTTVVNATSVSGGGNTDALIYLKGTTIDPSDKSTLRIKGISDAKMYVPSYTPGEKGYYILQFDGPVKEDEKTLLQGLGVGFDDYIPDYAFIVEMDDTALKNIEENIEGLDFVRFIGIYQPDYKIDPRLVNSTGNETTLNILIFDSKAIENISANIEDMGGVIFIKHNKLIRASIDSSKTEEISRMPGVKWIEEYKTPELLLDVSAGIVGAPDAWSQIPGVNGSGVTVAVIDTGIDVGENGTVQVDNDNDGLINEDPLDDVDNDGDNLTDEDNPPHPDFGINGSRIVELIDYTESDTEDGIAEDMSGHGTHVSGIVLGDGNASGGNYTGIAPGAWLVHQRVFDDSGLWAGPVLDILFNDTFKTGAEIVSNSWGASTSGVYTSEDVLVDYAVRENSLIMVFAAGNDGPTAGTTGSPGNAKNVITVGASENYKPSIGGTESDDRDDVAGFSSRGPTSDGRIKPDVVAPGSYIAATKATDDAIVGYQSINDFYRYISGTSMAAPHVAGEAALILQYYRDTYGFTPSPALVKALLINGAVDMGLGYPSNDQGWGRTNVSKSIFPNVSRVILYEEQNASLALSTGESREYYYYIGSTSTPLKVTLVWTDYPGSTTAAKTLVNDLDLVVSSPSGTIYNGNDFTAPYNDTTDSVNNVENVFIDVPDTGIYTVTINAPNVPVGPQSFALVVSGNATSVIPADLTLSSLNISFSPALPAEGQNITINASISNQGGSNANNVSVSFYDGVPGFNGVFLGNDTVSVLAGQSENATLVINTSGMAGSNTIYVVVDSDNQIVETDENNNQAYKLLIVNSAGADADLSLSLGDIYFIPSSPLEDQEVVVNVTIHNVGNANAPSFNVSFYNFTTLIGKDTISVSSGSEANASVVWTLSPTSGVHNITVIADEEDIIAETHEDNNNDTRQLVVGPNWNVELNITKVVVNGDQTHEISNDSTYFGTSGQSAFFDVTVSNPMGTAAVDAVVGLTLLNQTGGVAKVFPNNTIRVYPGGSVETRFSWDITSYSTLPTGIYNVSVSVTFLKNATEYKTIYDTSEYIKLVRLQRGRFWMEHADRDVAVGDTVEFIQEVTNTGDVSATAEFDVIVYWDNKLDQSLNYTYLIFPPDYEKDISTGGRVTLQPGETKNLTFIWVVDRDGCDDTDPGEWWTSSKFYYGRSRDYDNLRVESSDNVVPFDMEYVISGSETEIKTPEVAPGDTLRARFSAANFGATTATVHEAKGWIEYENGTVLMDLSPAFTTSVNIGTNGNCPDVGPFRAYDFEGALPVDLDSSVNYIVKMAIDNGVPRGLYLDPDAYPYAGFNREVTLTDFKIVEASLTDIYAREEIAYSITADIDAEVRNIGINQIDGSKVELTIYNETSIIYNQTSPMPLSVSQWENKTFKWTPISGEVNLGVYNVTATVFYGRSGSSSKTTQIEVVSLGISNVSTAPVAPYESTDIGVSILNLGPTNVTLDSVAVSIEAGNTTIPLGSKNGYEISYLRTFNFPYYFNQTGITNGSYPIKINMAYGGRSSVSSNVANITLLPVGIKSYSIPSIGVNTSSVPISVTLTNIGNSDVSVSLNLTDDSTLINQTTVTAAGGSDTTVNFNINITQLGTHNITITASYPTLPELLVRSGTIRILSTAPDLSISPSGISPSPSNPTTGQNVSITVIVNNLGTEDTDNVKVEFILDNNVSIANNTIDIANSSSNSTLFYWTAVQGTHDITIVVDPDDSITGEIDETNNNATISIKVTAPQPPSGGGGGGGGPLTYDIPKCVESLGMSDLSDEEIAELAYKCGHGSFPAKYIVSHPYASLAGVFASQDEVVLSPDLSKQLFKKHPSSKQGRIIKKEPTILGEDIYEAAAKYVLETTLRANKIVIVRGDLEADSIAASTFANLIGAKILLVKPDEVPYPTLDVLNKYRPNTVYIIGGEDAVSKEVADTIGKYAYKVERISGDTRYETSLEIARRIMEMSNPRVVVVTDGREPVTYAASLAVKLNAPLIYMDENSPEEVFKFIGENDFKVVAKLYNE